MRFEKFLVRKGYEVDLSGKHWKLRLPPYKGFTRMDTLDSRWTPQYLQDEIDRTYRSFGSISATVNLRPEWMPGYLFRVYTPYRRTNKIYQLYLFYCYQLGIFPEHSGHRTNSPYLKEELRFLDKFTAQVDYMEKHHIETMDDLYADREKLESELDVLISKRTKLQNKIRRADSEVKATLREEKQGVTSQITELCKRLKCNQDIEDRSEKIQQNLDRIHENEERNRQLKSKNRSRDAR